VPLDQPISLDDLVSGGRAAGPFLSPELPKPETPAWPTAEDLAPLTPSANGDGASSRAGDTQFAPLVLPKREPKYVPPEEPPPPPAAEVGSAALEDDVPTRRLPIYQSVLSRWFSEGDDAAADPVPQQSEGEDPNLPPLTGTDEQPAPVVSPEPAPAEPSREALSRTSTSQANGWTSRSAATASRQRTSSSRCSVFTTQKDSSTSDTASHVISLPRRP